MQRQGQIGPDGAPARQRSRASPASAADAVAAHRARAVRPRGARSSSRKVAWPTRGEVINYSTVVLVTLILLIGLILVLDYAFAKSVLFLFKA